MTAEGAGVSGRERYYAEFNRAYDVEFRESGKAGPHCVKAGIDAILSAGFGDVSEAHAESLERAAGWLDFGESVGNIGFEGPSNRAEVIDAYEAAIEDPAEWLRARAKEYRTTDTNGASA